MVSICLCGRMWQGSHGTERLITSFQALMPSWCNFCFDYIYGTPAGYTELGANAHFNTVIFKCIFDPYTGADPEFRKGGCTLLKKVEDQKKGRKQ